jgi:hypothetical protein
LLAAAAHSDETVVRRWQATTITAYLSDSRERQKLRWDRIFTSLYSCPEDIDVVLAVAHC